MRMEEESDEKLAGLVREEDRTAFSVLVRRHSQRFYRTAWRMSANSAEAEEISARGVSQVLGKTAALEAGQKRQVYNLVHQSGYQSGY